MVHHGSPRANFINAVFVVVPAPHNAFARNSASILPAYASGGRHAYCKMALTISRVICVSSLYWPHPG